MTFDPTILRKRQEPLRHWLFFFLSVPIYLSATGAAAFITAIVIVTVNRIDFHDPNFLAQIKFHYTGLYPAIATLLNLTLMLAVIGLVAKRRKTTIRDVLYLNPVPLGPLVSWVVVLFGYLGVMIIVSKILHQQAAIRTPLPLLLATCVVGPINEEVYFRGFAFSLLEKRSAWGAILFTSLFFALCHISASHFGLIKTFGVGIILGMSRLKTNSLLTPIILHMIDNMVSEGYKLTL